MLSDNIELDRRAGELVEVILASEEVVAGLAERETAQRANLLALDEALKQLRMSVQAAQEARSQIELDLVRKQSELKFLDETSRKELGSPAEELTTGEEAVLDEAGLIEAEQKYQEVKARIEALGPVNPQALEEFQDAQQRYDFLKRAASGSAGFDPRYRKGYSGDRRRIAQALHRCVRGDQRPLPRNVPHAVWRRHRRDAADG